MIRFWLGLALLGGPWLFGLHYFHEADYLTFSVMIVGAPCTRAVRLGESERAGRWWWEQDDQKECGLHVKPRATSQAAVAT